MRNLKTSDLFTLSKIVKKMNIKNDIKSLAKDITGLTEDEKIKAEQTMQIDLVMLFVENIGSAEKEIYNLFADITSKTAKEIEDMDLDKFIELITELFKQDGISNFLSQALK